MRGALLAITVSGVLVTACRAGSEPDPPDPPTDTDTDGDPPETDDPDLPETSEPGAPWDLTVIGQGYEAANGRTIRARMASMELVLVGDDEDTVEGGGWQARFRDALDPAEPGYYVAWWVDLDGDAICGEGDIAFLETVASADQDLIRVHTFNAGGIDRRACVGF